MQAKSQLTLTKTSPSEMLIQIPCLRKGEMGYHYDLATCIGSHFGRAVDRVALAEILTPLSDGGVPSVAHSLASRSLMRLDSRAQGIDLADINPNRLKGFSGMSPSLAEETFARRSTIITQGQGLGVHFYDRSLTVAELEALIAEHRVGLVSLDWNVITNDKSFTRQLEDPRDQGLLDPKTKGQPFFYPVVPLVGFDEHNFILHTYGFPYLPISKELFERARNTEKAEQTMVFISAADLASVPKHKEKPRPLEIETILNAYRIEERHAAQQEWWDDMIDSYGTDGKEFCQEFLEQSKEYGISHQLAEDLFHFVWTECEEMSPIYFHKLGQAMQSVRAASILEPEFSEFLAECLAVTRKERDEAAASSAATHSRNQDPMDRFMELCEGCVRIVTQYEGEGCAKLKTVLTYKLMDLALLPAPKEMRSGGRPVEVKDRPVLPDPFIIPDLTNLADAKFKIVHPPHPGEPQCVTKLRVMLEWLEHHGGEALRNCLIASLGKGSIRIGNLDHDISTTPFVMLSEALREKVRGVPFFIDALCLNHGLGGWELLNEYDQYVATHAGELPKIENVFRWEYTANEIAQAAKEANAAPASIAAEMRYLENLMPFMVAGKVHPSSAGVLKRMFRRADHRYSNDEGYRMLDEIGLAERYLDLLLKEESKLSHDKLWKAFDDIPNTEAKTKIEPFLTECLATRDLKTLNRYRAKVLSSTHSDKLGTLDGNDAAKFDLFTKEFLEFVIARKRELADESEASKRVSN